MRKNWAENIPRCYDNALLLFFLNALLSGRVKKAGDIRPEIVLLVIFACNSFANQRYTIVCTAGAEKLAGAIVAFYRIFIYL
jgi:hypothetical protein